MPTMSIDRSSPVLSDSPELIRRHGGLEIIGAEQVQLLNLNELVREAVGDMMPELRRNGATLYLLQDASMPRVSLLAGPVRAACGAIIHMLAQSRQTVPISVVTTWRGHRASVFFGRGSATAPTRPQKHWHCQQLAATGSVDLILGEQAIRALGGMLVVRRSGSDVAAQLDLPIIRNPQTRQPMQMGTSTLNRQGETNETEYDRTLC